MTAASDSIRRLRAYASEARQRAASMLVDVGAYTTAEAHARAADAPLHAARAGHAYGCFRAMAEALERTEDAIAYLSRGQR